MGPPCPRNRRPTTNWSFVLNNDSQGPIAIEVELPWVGPTPIVASYLIPSPVVNSEIPPLSRFPKLLSQMAPNCAHVTPLLQTPPLSLPLTVVENSTHISNFIDNSCYDEVIDIELESKIEQYMLHMAK